MDKLLEAAAIAWNPIGEVRRRLEDGSFTFKSVLAPFVGIIVGCNLFAIAAQKFFYETLLERLGSELPVHPLTNSDYALQMMSALGVLLPVAAVSLLPESAFHPRGRSTTGAALLVTAAAWAFYGAAVGSVIYFFAGALASANPLQGLQFYVFIGGPILIGMAGLLIFFWFRIMMSVLGYSGGQVAGITVVAIIVEAALVWFLASVLAASPEFQEQAQVLGDRLATGS